MPPKIQSTGGRRSRLSGQGSETDVPSLCRFLTFPVVSRGRVELGLTWMSDIFLNYVLGDLDKAEKLRAAFRQQGWTVWWNPQALYVGADNDEVDKELKDAKVIVSLWSSRATHEPSFAREVLKRANLLPTVNVLLEKVELPPEVRHTAAVSLANWNGLKWNAELYHLVSNVRVILDLADIFPNRGISITDLPPRPTESHAPAGNLPRIELSNEPHLSERSAESRVRSGTRFSGVFISYRRSEAAAYAGRLYDRLAARFGREKVFIDMENVGWGEDFVEAISEAAQSCAVMIVLISRGWSRGADEELDDYVRLEVAKALGRKIRVIPILIQGATMPAPKELPEDLAPLVRRNALALSDTRWERDVEDLIKSLESLLGN